MEFAAPEYSWLVLAVMIIILLMIRGRRLRRIDLLLLAEPRLLERLRLSEPADWRKQLLPVIGMLLLVIALMRPQWGEIEEFYSTSGLDIVVALDVSRSMLTDDLVPTRLSAARKAVEQLLDHQSGDRIGLLAFAGSAFLVCPLTGDHGIVRQMLAELAPESIPLGGSSLAAALTEAGRAFRGTDPGGRILVVVSDGEDHAGLFAPALDSLRREGVTIIAAQAGTSGGGVIPLPGGAFVKDRTGAVIKSRANHAVLRSIAPAVVVLGSDGDGLTAQIEQLRADKQESVRKHHRLKRADRYQYPLALACILFSCLFWLQREVRR